MRALAQRTRAIAAALIFCSSAATVLRAQQAPSEEPPAAGANAPTNESAPSEEQPLILFQDAEGEFEAVPYSEQRLLDEFSHKQADSPIAPVYISELRLDGDVEDDRVLLTANIAIEITADGAFDVPLRLNQARVHFIQHDGPGRASPILDAQRDDGLHWRLEGVGTHRLELAFWVPLRTSPAGHQLLLTLPALPDYLVTRLRLEIPGNQSVLPRPEIVDLQQQHGDDGTEVTAEIKGRLELTWAENSESANTLSSVRTGMTLRRDGAQLLLDGKQEFTVEQGPLSRVEVRLPEEFELQDMFLVGAGEQRIPLDPRPLPDDPRMVSVALPEPNQKFTLVWTLERAFPEEGGIVLIDGPDVTEAGQSQGEIRIETVDGYRVLWDKTRSQGVRRMTVREEVSGSTLWGGFRFEDAIHLQLEIEPIAPKTDLDVAYYLRVNDDELLLTMDVSLHVLTGSVRELQFVWPDRNQEGWEFDRRIQATSDGETVPADFDDMHEILRLGRPLVGAEALRARLRFRRDFPIEQSDAELTLPQVSGAPSARAPLFIAQAIDLTAELTGDSPRRRPMDQPGDELESPPAGFEDARGWELIEGPAPLHIQRIVHSRTVTTTTYVTIGSPDDSVLPVAEEFEYQVAYGRIETMLFEAPDEVPEVASLQFSDEQGNPLESTFDGKRYTVTMQPPRDGLFRVRLEFAVPFPDMSPGSRQEYQLPIVQPVDADVRETAVQTRPAAPISIDVSARGWQSKLDPSGRTFWHAAGNQESCRLDLRFAAREFAQRLDIEGCYLQTEVNEGGSAKTHGVYLLERPPAEVLISLPLGHSEAEFYWNGEPLAAAQDTVDGPYLLALPAASPESGRLGVNYQVGGAADSGALIHASVGFPSFGSDVNIEETIWEVVPPHRHLLSRIPETMTPQFDWQRKTVLWMRMPTQYVEARRADILGETAGEMTPFKQANGYAFSTTGSVPSARIESMSQSLVVFIGAGLTLLLGFVFGRFPAVRNVYSLLVLAFLCSLAAIWYLDLVQLLVQPAVVGVCLAVLAVTFDTATRRGSVFRRNEASSPDITSDTGDRVSSVPGVRGSAVARTALYPTADASNSGSHPHD